MQFQGEEGAKANAVQFDACEVSESSSVMQLRIQGTKVSGQRTHRGVLSSLNQASYNYLI